MSAIAFDLPDEISAGQDGLMKFARAEILSRHERHRDLLEDPRRLYQENDQFRDEAVSLIWEVRQISAEAG